VVPLAATCCMLLARVSTNPDEALAWARKALLDAEVCGQPAMEAEALFQASRTAASPAQAEWFMTSAGDAWRRATAGHELVLGILQQPPAPADLFRAIADLCRTEARAERVALFWEDQDGTPTSVAAEGPPYANAAYPAQELEAAREASMGVLLLPLDAGPSLLADPQPWGALLVAGIAPDRAERLEKLLTLLGGALWAARAIWLHERAAQRPTSV